MSTGDPGPQLPRIPDPWELRQPFFSKEYNPVQPSLPLLRRLWHAAREHGMSAEFNTWLQHYLATMFALRQSLEEELYKKTPLPKLERAPSQESSIFDPMDIPSEGADLFDTPTEKPLWHPAHPLASACPMELCLPVRRRRKSVSGYLMACSARPAQGRILLSPTPRRRRRCCHKGNASNAPSNAPRAKKTKFKSKIKTPNRR